MKPQKTYILNKQIPIMSLTLFAVGLVVSGLSTAQALSTHTGLPIDNLRDQAIQTVSQTPIDSLAKPSSLLEQTQQKIQKNGIVTSLKAVSTLATEAILNNQGHEKFREVTLEDGWQAIDREWLLLLDTKDLQYFQGSMSTELEVLETRYLASLDSHVVRLRSTDNTQGRTSLQQLLQLSNATLLDNLTFDRHHVFSSQIEPNQIETDQKKIPQKQQPLKSLKTTLTNIPAPRIGMIDSAISLDHNALRHAQIKQQRFIASDLIAPTAHGTAVAGIIVGQGNTFSGALPTAHLFAAAVFYEKKEYQQSASTLALLEAINWLLEQKVTVINMSLTGPPNLLLEKAIKKAVTQDVIFVAAAGNAGPSAPPLYPAAFDNVIAVTAVDKNKRIYRWANRGEHIDFAALGVAVMTARADGSEGIETGTSIASPRVAAELLKLQLNTEDEPSMPNTSYLQLKKNSLDLGDPGKDIIYGYGLVGF